VNKRLLRRLLRNHDTALRVVLSSDASVDARAAREAATAYLDKYPVEELLRLARLAGEQEGYGGPAQTRNDSQAPYGGPATSQEEGG
jgi:hypothetical protein